MGTQPIGVYSPVAPVRIADLQVDALHRRIRQGDREIRLTPAEHTVLYTLAARAGVWVTYREISDALGLPDPALGNMHSLRRHVSTLRHRLHDDATQPRYVETLGGVGYRFRPG